MARPFKTEKGIKQNILKNYSHDIDFLVSEYDQEREYVEADFFDRMIEPEDMGLYTVYNLTPDRRWESYTEWYNEKIEEIRNG